MADYQSEHDAYVRARHAVVEVLEAHGRYQVVDRSLIPNFLFARDDVILALGQDGVVANTLKYLDGQPLVGINPEPARFDGLLLPFQPMDVARILPDVLADKRNSKSITLAQATLSDGQSLLAVNDFFVGPKSHTSARYRIALGSCAEIQSSSGVIVSTGLGSTAWMKSIATGSMAVAAALGAASGKAHYDTLPWDSPVLRFAVREPFPSRASGATLIFGDIGPGASLELRSMMGGNGVIFSDGIEADFLEFNSGVEARIATSARVGHLVV